MSTQREAGPASLDLDPANSLALSELGHALTETDDANSAAVVLQKALRANPETATAYADLGTVWEMQEESDKAVQAYESALRCDPSQLNLRYKLSRQKDERKAMETLQNP